MGPSALILLAGVLGAIGAYWSSLRRSETEKQLQKKTDDIVQLNRTITGLVSGGDSYCFFMPTIDYDKNTCQFLVVHKGQFPIYDVSARICDVERMNQLVQAQQQEGRSHFDLTAADSYIQLGTIPVGRGIYLPPFPIGSVQKLSFSIFFGSRNSVFNQTIELRKVGNQWLSSDRVERDGKVLFEFMNDEFPKDAIEPTK